MINTALSNIEFRTGLRLNSSSVKELAGGGNRAYGAIGYRIFDRVYLVAPENSEYSTAIPKGERIGNLVEIKGCLLEPRLSTLRDIDVPAVVVNEEGIHFNASPITNFQKWLQGEHDIGPYLNWHDRLFWLDELASLIVKIISQYSGKLVQPRRGSSFFDDNKRIIVLRHDVDASADTTYLKEEINRGLPATHAVLPDSNMRFWLKELSGHNNIETAYHFYTDSNFAPSALMRRLRGFLDSINLIKKSEQLPLYLGRRNDAFAKQVERAKALGIGVETIHRHWGFLRYPEFICALENVFEKFPECLGSSSFFQTTVFKNGASCANSTSAGYRGYFQDIQFPFWFPFKLHNPVTNKRLRGWESTHYMEPEPETFEYMLNKKIDFIHRNVFTLGFHPAHARTKTFHENGKIEDFLKIIDIAKSNDCKFMTLKGVCAAAERENAS